MNIHLCCVGKLKERFFTEGCAEYAKRLTRYCRCRETEVPDEKAPEELSLREQAQVREKEGRRLLAAIGPREYVIALAIGGKTYTSEALAAHLEELEGRGREVCFVIGGSLGLSESVLKRADRKVSFSRLTFPHQLMRVILLEQIYRSYRIIKGEPYHK